MDKDKILNLKDKIYLNKIKKDIEQIDGINILTFLKYDDFAVYNEMVDEIIKIDYPIICKKERCSDFLEYIKFGYKKLGFELTEIKWIIPFLKKSNVWIEIQGVISKKFIDYCISENNNSDFLFFDMKNNFLMDIENGEDYYEYRVIKDDRLS